MATSVTTTKNQAAAFKELYSLNRNEGLATRGLYYPLTEKMPSFPLQTRSCNFFLAGVSFTTISIDTLLGLSVGFFALLTLGYHQPSLNLAVRQLHQSEQIFAIPFKHLLSSVDLKGSKTNLPFSTVGMGKSSPLCSIGRISLSIGSVFFNILGFITALFSLITLGSFESVNNFSQKNLRITVVSTLFIETIRFLHPSVRIPIVENRRTV